MVTCSPGPPTLGGRPDVTGDRGWPTGPTNTVARMDRVVDELRRRWPAAGQCDDPSPGRRRPDRPEAVVVSPCHAAFGAEAFDAPACAIDAVKESVLVWKGGALGRRAGLGPPTLASSSRRSSGRCGSGLRSQIPWGRRDRGATWIFRARHQRGRRDHPGPRSRPPSSPHSGIDQFHDKMRSWPRRGGSRAGGPSTPDPEVGRCTRPGHRPGDGEHHLRAASEASC